MPNVHLLKVYMVSKTLLLLKGVYGRWAFLWQHHKCSAMPWKPAAQRRLQLNYVQLATLHCNYDIEIKLMILTIFIAVKRSELHIIL